MTKHGSEPAFPQPLFSATHVTMTEGGGLVPVFKGFSPGMTVRQWLAGMALCGMHARDSYDDGQRTPEQRARLALIDADALLSEDAAERPVGVPEDSKLLPCPFCGESEELYQCHRDLGRDAPYAIDCLGCGMDFTPREDTDVVAAWNRRASPTPPASRQSDEVVEELVRALEAARQFILGEYSDERSIALEGEPVSKEARAVYETICSALSRARGGET